MIAVLWSEVYVVREVVGGNVGEDLDAFCR